MNSASFNQDVSCVAVGTPNGYKIFNCNPFSQFHAGGEGAIGQVEMLFSTSLIVVVGQGEDPSQSPRRLKVINTKRQVVICELTFPTAIFKVLMNRQRLVVVLEHQIFIYNIASMKLLHTLETIPNPLGVADLSSTGDSSVLVYPSGPPARHTVAPPSASSSKKKSNFSAGEFTVLDCMSLTPLNVIKAHRSPLSNLTLSSDGTLLASTSDRGTIIRVFSIPGGTLLHQFRRGSYTSKIYSICFNLNSSLLAVSSSTNTVHIYRLKSEEALDLNGSALSSGSEGSDTESPPENAAIEAVIAKKKKGYLPSLKRKVSMAKGMLPTAVADMWEPKSRDFAWFKVPGHFSSLGHGKHVLGLPPLANLIYVAAANGMFYHFQINMEHGGECVKVAEFSLI